MTTPAPGVARGADTGPSANGFPRSVRLISRKDYDRVFARPFRSRDEGFTVLARSNGCKARLGLAIAKRQIASAAKRNRVKRRIRESFRHHRLELQGIDIVVIAKRGVEAWSTEAIFLSLDRHWSCIRRKLSP